MLVLRFRDVRLWLLLIIYTRYMAASGVTNPIASNSSQNSKRGSAAKISCSELYNIDPNFLKESTESAIYRANDKRSGQRVILKVFNKIIGFNIEADNYRQLRKRITFASCDPHPKVRISHLQRKQRMENYYVQIINKCYFEGKLTLVIEYMYDVLIDTINRIYAKQTSTTVAPVRQLRPNLTPQKFKWCAYQLIEMVFILHSVSIFHLDLKPHNMGLTYEGALKLFDFGILFFGESKLPQEYIGTIEYSAPEMNLGTSHQGNKLDMWSVGCIIYELFTGRKFSAGIREYSDTNVSKKCAHAAAYLYIKWSFGTVTPFKYEREERLAVATCPQISSHQSKFILRLSPNIYHMAYPEESHVQRFTEVQQKWYQFTYDYSLPAMAREDPYRTTPDEIVQLLTGLLMFDFDDRKSAGQALAQYSIFKAFRAQEN